MNTPRLFQRLELCFWDTAIEVMVTLPYLPRRLRRLASAGWLRQLELPRWVFILPAAFVVVMLPALLLVSQLPAAVQRRAAPAPASAAAGATAPLITSVTQRTILVVQVDRFDQPAPRLEAVWMLIYLPPAPPLTLLPVYPTSAAATLAQDQKLESSFRLDSQGRPETAFLQELIKLDLHWDNFLVLDEAGLAEIVELSSGPTYPLTGKTGQQAVESLVMPWEDRPAAITGQINLARQLCLNGSRLAEAVPADGLWRLLSNHIRTDFTKNQFVSDWRNLLQSSAALICEFPTQKYQTTDLPTQVETTTPLPVAPWAKP